MLKPTRPRHHLRPCRLKVGNQTSIITLTHADHACYEGNQNGSSKVYDIETLIELGKTTKITRKQLRFSEEAPAGMI